MTMKLSELERSNWLIIALLITGGILAVIAGVGYAVNPRLFSTFSWLVFIVIVSIATYMLYNMKRILDEIHKNNNNSKH